MKKGRLWQPKYVFWDVLTLRVLNVSTVEKYKIDGRWRLPKNIIRFDSVHEFKVYRELTRIFDNHQVVRQHKLEIIAPCKCYPNGKTWRVDFAIATLDRYQEYDLFVEAKGVFTPEFGVTLALLEQLQPDAFDKVRVIFPHAIPDDNRVVRALIKTEFKENLHTLTELEAMRCLR